MARASRQAAARIGLAPAIALVVLVSCGAPALATGMPMSPATLAAWSPAGSLRAAPDASIILASSSGEPELPEPADPDLLPFAGNEPPHAYPAITASIGVGWYVSAFEGAEAAFHATEQFYRDQGYDVPSAAPVDIGPVVMPTLSLDVTRSVGIALQAGRSLGTDEFLLAGGLVTGRVPLRADERISLRAGLGGGAYRFSIERPYSVLVTPIAGDGSYSTLDRIRLEGGAGYWTALGALAVRLGPEAALEGRAQYVDASDVSTTTPRGTRTTVNASGTLLALSLKILF